MFINQTNSTNDWLKLHPERDVVWTTWQTAGRGQAGNTWESEQGKNVLLSLRLREPNVPVEQQFRLTMVISLAVQEVVANLLPQHHVTIKWPNDIYVGDKKICGMLIENTLSEARIADSIIGIGLNVNQTTWLSSAPNPVSLKQLTESKYAPQTIFDKLFEAINNKIPLLNKPEILKALYLTKLYRFGQKALYSRRDVSIVPSRILTTTPENAFEATITDVTEQGELVLDDQKFHFKEIQFVL